eukprot:82381-Chlamydomonas_euryale.AAC.3
MPGTRDSSTAAPRRMNTSSAADASTLGRCTLTATVAAAQLPCSFPRYTCPRLAAASGSSDSHSNTASTGRPRPSSSTSRASSVEKRCTLSCRRLNSSMYSCVTMVHHRCRRTHTRTQGAVTEEGQQHAHAISVRATACFLRPHQHMQTCMPTRHMAIYEPCLSPPPPTHTYMRQHVDARIHRLRNLEARAPPDSAAFLPPPLMQVIPRTCGSMSTRVDAACAILTHVAPRPSTMRRIWAARAGIRPTGSPGSPSAWPRPRSCAAQQSVGAWTRSGQALPGHSAAVLPPRPWRRRRRRCHDWPAARCAGGLQAAQPPTPPRTALAMAPARRRPAGAGRRIQEGYGNIAGMHEAGPLQSCNEQDEALERERRHGTQTVTQLGVRTDRAQHCKSVLQSCRNGTEHAQRR